MDRVVEANECLAFAFVAAVDAVIFPGDIVTGMVELVLLPLPNWPHWFAPQHRTVPPPGARSCGATTRQ